MGFFEVLSRKTSGAEVYQPVKAVFFGDSVTHGCFELVTDYTGNMQCILDYDAVYHNRLRNMIQSVFPYTALNIINSGIAGNTAVQGLKRLESDVLAFNPDLVVICFGLNDVMLGNDGIHDYEASLREILRKLKEKHIETIFMTPNMLNTYVSPLLSPGYAEIAKSAADFQNSGMMDYYMDRARTICLNENIKLCDCYAKWKALYKYGADITLMLSNYINHPTREMHRSFAASLFDVLL